MTRCHETRSKHVMAKQILHITDPHLVGEPGATLHGWRVHDAFETVLADALAFAPNADALVLGGDLVDDASTMGYRRLNERLAPLTMPVLAIAGNHESPDGMARELTSTTVHGRIDLGDWVLTGLNSHRPDSQAGRLGTTQIAALARELADDPRPHALFVHHPGWAIGSAWQDAIGLADRDALAAVVADAPNARALVCGHAHQAGSKSLPGATGFLTASTMRQFKPGATAFTEDHARAPGYRVLTLDSNGHVSSTHRRVAAAWAAFVDAN